MIIEVSGIPGVGKSTVIKELILRSNDKNLIFNFEEFILNKRIIKCNNILLFDIYIFSKFYLLKKKDILILKKSLQYIKKSDNTFFNKLNIIRNIVKKIIIYRYTINHKRTFVLDESVSHILFNLFVDNEKKYDKNIIEDFLKILPSPNKILVIDAPDEVIKTRIIDRGLRGHRRIDFNNLIRFNNFMNQSRIVIETIKESKKVIVYNNDKQLNVKEILNKLDIKNV